MAVALMGVAVVLASTGWGVARQGAKGRATARLAPLALRRRLGAYWHAGTDWERWAAHERGEG